ncbi:MAG TPA: alpha/beta hydrolase-fold protein [Bacteroidota bacterium]|nr:alpha/beta hydrolase-fold protein [Bacteroidota bacterium]
MKGNLIGDSHTREMAVLLPPSYFKSNTSRYPTVYLLHGLGKRKDGQLESIDMLTKFFDLMKEKRLGEMILVAADGTTTFGGSYYADSPAIGNFEEYIAQEIVQHIDSLYHTNPGRNWRAIAGFSMGGHGAIKIGMKYNNVFGQVGSLSGSPLSIRYRKSIYKKALEGHKKPASLEGLVEKIRFETEWSLAAAYAKAAAFSPNPTKPPLYLDLPFEYQFGEERDPIWQKWLDDDPLSLVSRYSKNLSTLDQIYIDHGDDETTLGTEDFLRELVRYGIGYTYYIFRGDHVDELFLRYVRMLKFLSVRW